MTRSDEVFLRSVVQEVPELQPLLDEHVKDQYGVVLPHVLMGEIQSWAEAHVDSDPEAIRRLVLALDPGITSGDEMVENVVAISFLEYLPAADAPGGRVRALLTPALIEALAELES